MQSVRMYTGDDGKTHFEDLDFQFDAVTEVNRTSVENASGIQFVYQPPGFVISMHPAPRRQYVITIQGQAEIQLGDGTTFTFIRSPMGVSPEDATVSAGSVSPSLSLSLLASL